MTVLVLTACPPKLRGLLTRWLMEISPGVYVGFVSTRIRELLWVRIIELVGRGRALMVYSTNNEQRLAFLVHGHAWEPTDFDGIQLMMRPLPADATSDRERDAAKGAGAPKNWSSAGRRRRYASKANRTRAREGETDE